MKSLSLQKLGGIGALLVACCTLLFVCALLIAPLDTAWTGLPSWPHVLADYALAWLALFGLAAVPALSARVAALSEGWVRWTSTIATLGFAVLAVTSFWQADYERGVISESQSVPTYVYDEAPASSVDDDAPEAVSAPMLVLEQLVLRAPQGWLEAAGVGLWIFSVSWLARSGVLPHSLVWLGLLAGLLSMMTAVGAAFDLTLLKLGGIMGGLVLTPLWFGRMGVVLLQTDGPQPALAIAGGAPLSIPRKKYRIRTTLPAYLDRNPMFKRIRGLYGNGA
jgi:hypothetical protein